MTDTYESIWQEVRGHSDSVDSLLVQSWVRDTWREVAEARSWSWLRRKLAINIAAPYTTGTVTLTPGYTTATFAGATLDQSMVGRQFRLDTTGHIYDITSVDASAGTAELFPAYAETAAAVTGQSYKIFTAYITPPDSDFFAWISVTNPSVRKRLRLHINNETIDYYDAGRNMATGSSNSPACLSGIDWSRSYAGQVSSALQVVGAGPGPVIAGTYTGQASNILVITITTGGAIDIAQFSYRVGTGTTTTGQTCASAGNILPNGVGLSWPAAGVFVLNDVFVARLTARPQYGVPRYELYPHHSSILNLSATYTTRVTDIDDPSFVLPYTMRGDVIKVGALAKMARQYPGTDQRPNPFSQIARAQALEEKFAAMLDELQVADDYIMETNVIDPTEQWELALLPWMNASGSGLRATATYDPLDLLYI